MNPCRRQLGSILLAAALLLSAAGPVLSNPGAKPDNPGKSNPGKPDGAGKPGDPGSKGGGSSGGNAGGQGNARGRRNPTDKVQGGYEVKIAGYYTGTGRVKVTGDGVTITGDVKDPQNNQYALKTDRLEVLEDRFRGEGTLGGMKVTIDGRVDPADPDPAKTGGPPGKSKNRVLLKGRVTFTFRTETDPIHRARGAGELRDPAN